MLKSINRLIVTLPYIKLIQTFLYILHFHLWYTSFFFFADCIMQYSRMMHYGDWFCSKIGPTKCIIFAFDYCFPKHPKQFLHFNYYISFIANYSFELSQQPIRLDRLGMVSVLLVLDDCYYGSVKELPRVNCSAFYLPTPSKISWWACMLPLDARNFIFNPMLGDQNMKKIYKFISSHP